MGRAVSLEESYDIFMDTFNIYNLIASEDYYNYYKKHFSRGTPESHFDAVKEEIEKNTGHKIPKKYIKMIEKEIEEKHKILRNPPDWIKNLIYDFLISKEFLDWGHVSDELLQKVRDTLIPFKFARKNDDRLIYNIIAYRIKPTENGISFYDRNIEMTTREKINLINFLSASYSISAYSISAVSEIMKKDFKNAKPTNEPDIFSLEENIDEDIKKAIEFYGLYLDSSGIKGFLRKRIRNTRSHISFTFDIPEEIKDAEGISKYVIDYINSKKDYIIALSEIIDAMPDIDMEYGSLYNIENIYISTERHRGAPNLILEIKPENILVRIIGEEIKPESTLVRINSEYKGKIEMDYKIDFSNYNEAVNKIKEIIKNYKEEFSAFLDKINEKNEKIKYTMYDGIFEGLYHIYVKGAYKGDKDVDTATISAFGFEHNINMRKLYDELNVHSRNLNDIIMAFYRKGIINIKDNKVLINGETLESHFASENIEVEKGFIDFANSYIKGLVNGYYNIIDKIIRGKKDEIKEIIDKTPAQTLAFALLTRAGIDNKIAFEYIPDELKREALSKLPPDNILEILMRADKQTLEKYRILIENNLSGISPFNRYIAKYIYDYHKEKIQVADASLTSLSSDETEFFYFKTDRFIILINKIEGDKISFVFASPTDKIGVGYTEATLKDALLKALNTYSYAVGKIKSLHIEETGRIINTDKPIFVPMYKNRIIIADRLNKIEEEIEKEEEEMANLEPA